MANTRAIISVLFLIAIVSIGLHIFSDQAPSKITGKTTKSENTTLCTEQCYWDCENDKTCTDECLIKKCALGNEPKGLSAITSAMPIG